MQFGQLSDGGSRFSTTDADVVGVSSDGGLLDALRVESRELVTHTRWVDLVVCELARRGEWQVKVLMCPSLAQQGARFGEPRRL